IRHFAEAHRSEFSQCQYPGIGCGGNYGSQQSVRNGSVMLIPEQRVRHGLRPAAKATDGLYRSGFGIVKDHWSDAGDVDQFALHNAENETARYACVEGIASGLENVECGLG